MAKGEFKIAPQVKEQLTASFPEHPIFLPHKLKPAEKPEIKQKQLEAKKTDMFYLDKIMPMILDPNVISIECMGPGKFIMVRTTRRAMRANVMLNPEDIDDIIQRFSNEARIPRIGGVFKAIVDNLVMTAIDSDVGSKRFIISKTHPYDSEFL